MLYLYVNFVYAMLVSQISESWSLDFSIRRFQGARSLFLLELGGKAGNTRYVAYVLGLSVQLVRRTATLPASVEDINPVIPIIRNRP